MSKRNLILLVCAVALLLVLWRISATEERYTYQRIVVVEAKYGEAPDEFGLEHYDGIMLGAITFDVDSSGTVFIYDGPKGEIKVFGDDGEYKGTLRAFPTRPGRIPTDMAVAPDGDIYVLVESAKMSERISVYRLSGSTQAIDTLTLGLSADFAMRDDIPTWASVWLTADRDGSVYLVDRYRWRTLTLVRNGIALVPEEQLRSAREGWPVESGYWVNVEVDDSDRGASSVAVVNREGTIVSSLRRTRGATRGVDSEGNIYVKVCEPGPGPWGVVFKILVYSHAGEHIGTIEIPSTTRASTSAYGKGARELVTGDGSVYELIGGNDAVRVGKWERVNKADGH